MSTGGAYLSLLENHYGLSAEEVLMFFDKDSLDVVVQALHDRKCVECPIDRYGNLDYCESHTEDEGAAHDHRPPRLPVRGVPGVHLP